MFVICSSSLPQRTMFSIIRSAGVIALLLVAVSSGQPSGDQNLWFHDNNNNLRSTSVSISIDQDLTNERGMTVELNCISPETSPFSFQQFAFMVDPSDQNSLFGQVTTWSGSNTLLEINAFTSFLSNLSTLATIPTGQNLDIQLTNDKNGIITSVDFSVTQSNALLGKGTIDLTKQNLTSGGPALATLSPIFACTFNIVGFGNDTNSTYSSGSGIITYSSQNSLNTSLDTPPGSVFTDIAAPETSNVEYGQKIVQKGKSSSYTQTFNVPRA